MWLRGWVLCAAATCIAACTSAPTGAFVPGDGGPAASDGGPPRDGGTTDGGAPACGDHETVALVPERYADQTIALYVPVETMGKQGLLHLDTASAQSLLFAPGTSGWIDAYATARLGCSERTLPGYAGLGTLPDVEGRPVLGMGGADLLLREPTWLDVEGARLHRNPTAAMPAQPDGGLDVPFRVVQGIVVVEALFDGKAVRLILDTGAGHTTFVDANPRPGETRVETVDALGNPLELFQSTIVLGLGRQSSVVTLVRAPRFDIVAQLSTALGVHLDGLLGLSALRSVYVDGERGLLQIRLTP